MQRFNLGDSIKYNLSKDTNTHILPDPNVSKVLELTQLILPYGDTVNPISYSEASKFDINTIHWVMYGLGLYTFPVTELIDYLRSEIPELGQTIEVGAGTGWLGKSLGIVTTDSKLQDNPEIRKLYQEYNQPTINYPDFVEKLDAVSAIKKYQPNYVIGSYITDNKRNIYGVDNVWVANNCRKYYFIGNKNIHLVDPVMKRRFKTEIILPFLITRGDSTKARIWIFESKLYNSPRYD